MLCLCKDQKPVYEKVFKSTSDLKQETDKNFRGHFLKITGANLSNILKSRNELKFTKVISELKSVSRLENVWEIGPCYFKKVAPGINLVLIEKP